MSTLMVQLNTLLDEIKPLLDLAHNRCSISKLIKNSTHVSVIANLYHEKEKGA